MGNDFPHKGKDECRSWCLWGQKGGLGGAGLVQGKLVGSQAEPEPFGGLLTHTLPQQRFLGTCSELSISLPLSTQAGSPLLCPWLASHKHSLTRVFWKCCSKLPFSCLMGYEEGKGEPWSILG